jgi:hypothetical protein
LCGFVPTPPPRHEGWAACQAQQCKTWGLVPAGLGFPRVIRDNRGMAKKDRAEAAAENDIHVLIEDAQELTPKELDQERKAALEERQRRSWLSHTPEQLANRIPVSVFAMGDLVTPN